MSNDNVHFNAEEFEREQNQGYLDGWQAGGKQPTRSLKHRSASYRYGWSNGNDDRLGKARVSGELKLMHANAVLAVDMAWSAT
ncbi:hypothetical protein AB4037_10925 [Labrys sp. KB_33_2]|uniref:hypothetical protein n=1 Tax=unclassified Labrys (in: a-proteobacteria) TaxID=2688601 RepID=UPI003EBBE987